MELGGTVGDIESQPFLVALRQLRNEEGKNNVMFVHVTYVPYLEAAKEFKTKPTQHSTKELRSTGISPDMIVCRSSSPIDDELQKKIANFCDVDERAVVNTPDASSIYEVPLVLDKKNVGSFIKNRINLNVEPDSSKLDEWRKVVKSLKIQSPTVKIGIVGKYVELEDAYISIRESLLHGAADVGVNLKIEYISSDVDNLDETVLNGLDGILIPGGFGERGFEGKLEAVEYAIVNQVPIFGICLGMHSMVTQFARRSGFDDANSTEFDKDVKYPVIDLMEEQKKVKQMGMMSEWKAFAALAVVTLGMPSEAMPFYESSSSYKRRAKRALTHILKSGNLGHNNDVSYRTKHSAISVNIITFFRRLRDFAKFSMIFPLDSPYFFVSYLVNRIR